MQSLSPWHPLKSKILTACLSAVLFSSCATTGLDRVRTPAAKRDPLECGRYQDPEERRICAIIARQSLEAIGLHVQNRLLTARSNEALRVPVPYPQFNFDTDVIATIVAAFSGGGIASTTSSAILSRRPGTFANRLLESVAVLPTGVKGLASSVFSTGGILGVAAMTSAPRPTVENPTSFQTGSTTLMLVFRKQAVSDEVVRANEKHRANAEAAFSAEISDIAATVINERVQPLLYLDEEQAAMAISLIKAELETAFRTPSGGFDEDRTATLDLLKILKASGADARKRLAALDDLLREIPENAVPDASKVPENARSMVAGYRFLIVELEDMAQAVLDWKDANLAPTLQSAGKEGPSKARLQALDHDMSQFITDLNAFTKRLEMTRKILRE